MYLRGGKGARRQLIPGEAEFARARGGSEVGGAYASIHKTRPSPTPSTLLQANR